MSMKEKGKDSVTFYKMSEIFLETIKGTLNWSKCEFLGVHFLNKCLGLFYE